MSFERETGVEPATPSLGSRVLDPASNDLNRLQPAQDSHRFQKDEAGGRNAEIPCRNSADARALADGFHEGLVAAIGEEVTTR